MTKYSKSDRLEAIARLREWLKPGDTIHCVLRHVSRSGMSRVISFKHIGPLYRGAPEIGNLDYNIAVALDLPNCRGRHDGVTVAGCGMDMGFHVVYSLARTLWPDGYECTGDGAENRCMSNDHTNGDRDYTPHLHRDGGYALQHRWL